MSCGCQESGSTWKTLRCLKSSNRSSSAQLRIRDQISSERAVAVFTNSAYRINGFAERRRAISAIGSADIKIGAIGLAVRIEEVQVVPEFLLPHRRSSARPLPQSRQGTFRAAVPVISESLDVHLARNGKVRTAGSTARTPST